MLSPEEKAIQDAEKARKEDAERLVKAIQLGINTTLASIFGADFKPWPNGVPYPPEEDPEEPPSTPPASAS